MYKEMFSLQIKVYVLVLHLSKSINSCNRLAARQTTKSSSVSSKASAQGFAYKRTRLIFIKTYRSFSVCLSIFLLYFCYLSVFLSLVVFLLYLCLVVFLSVFLSACFSVFQEHLVAHYLYICFSKCWSVCMSVYMFAYLLYFLNSLEPDLEPQSTLLWLSEKINRIKIYNNK